MRKPLPLRNRYGYMLLPVIMTLSLVAVAALLLNRAVSLQFEPAVSRNKTIKARYLAEAALSHAKWRMRKNCAYRTAIPETSLGGGTYSATLSDTTDGSGAVRIVATGKLASTGEIQSLTEDFHCVAPQSLYWTDVGLSAVRKMEKDGTGLKDIITSASGLVSPKNLDIDAERQQIYFSDQHRIYRGNITVGLTKVINCSPCQINGIGVDPVGGKIYWLDNASGCVLRAKLDGASPQGIFCSFGAEFSALAVDSEYGRFFWADTAAKTIKARNLEGLDLPDTISTGYTVTAIALDPIDRKIYFFDKDSHSIGRIDYNGDNFKNIITLGESADINGLDLDTTEGRLYWADASGKTIEAANMVDGGKRVLIKKFSDTEKPWGLSLGPRHVVSPRTKGPYWVNTSKEKIQRSELDGTKVADVVSGMNNPVDIEVDAANDILYWTDDKYVRASFIDGSGVTDIHECSGAPKDCSKGTGFAIDTEGRYFYLLDDTEGKIFRGNLAGCLSLNTLVSGLDKPKDIALDLTNKKMYWSDEGVIQAIYWANLDGTGNVPFLSSSDLPFKDSKKQVRALALDPLDPAGGKIYWYSQDTKKIYRANLSDGSGIESIISSGLSNVRRLALDLAEGKLYWTDFDQNKVYRANLNGSSSKSLVSVGEHVSGITIVPAAP